MSYEINHHSFTDEILSILKQHFSEDYEKVFKVSPLLQYLNKKTNAASKNSKARNAFANLYALYVLIEDYIEKGYCGFYAKSYELYEGARYTDLSRRQRELPFGSNLQNHALNSRLNSEFKTDYPSSNSPIIREGKRYRIEETLLTVPVRSKYDHKHYNIAQVVIDIINRYAEIRKAAFEEFLQTCQEVKNSPEKAIDFITKQLEPTVDARIFEIVSYAILKTKYGQQTVWLGDTKETVSEENLILYKTGRTNANDGGIDFVMKPLGRFFQVTETIDVNKYFLDIDKVQRFPITFVVKSNETVENILATIHHQAIEKYKIETVVNNYMAAIEEIINTQNLIDIFSDIVKSSKLQEVMDEIVKQSKVEFNYDE